jgi:indole-3-glycerol phosphate synthase
MSAARLDAIVADVRRRAAERRVKQPLARIRELVREDSWRRERFLAPFRTAAPGRADRFAIVAEMKRRTPWSGPLLEEDSEARANVPTRLPRPGARWFALAQSLAQGGAVALSVATEQDHFGGSLDDLRTVEFTRLPRLRRDLVVDEAMLWESCLYGADAVSLVPAILEDGELATLRNVARELGLAVMIEVHDERELERALPLEPELLAVGARSPDTFELDRSVFERLLPRVPTSPSSPIRVAASGIRDLDDLRRARDAGASAALVGEALAREPDPENALRAWTAALNG